MPRRRETLLALAGLMIAGARRAFAAAKLYFKDGTYQLAREYEVVGDRVRFYSTERGEWEEVPVALVDLPRTRDEERRLESSAQQDARMEGAENQAEREARRDAASVPRDPGAYLFEGGKMIPVPAAESKVVNDRKRNILKVLSPIPIVAGKATVEVAGEHAPTVAHGGMPEFYIRLAEAERFGIIRLKPHKGSRIAEKLTIIPVANQTVEQPDLIEVFRQQAGEGLYKIWPMKPLEAGEYAVAEYSEGELNMQIWDFSCAPAAPARQP